LPGSGRLDYKHIPTVGSRGMGGDKSDVGIEIFIERYCESIEE